MAIAPPLVSPPLEVNVMVFAAGVAVVEINVKQALVPASRVIVAVTVAPVLKLNPVGALKIMVPLEGKSPCAPSVKVGPVNVVQVAVPFVVFVSAEIAEPPVAAVTVADANAVPAGTKKPLMINIAADNTKKRLFNLLKPSWRETDDCV